MKKFLVFNYGLFLLCFVAFSYAFVDPNLSYMQKIYTGFHTQNRESTAIIYGMFLFLFFIHYFIFSVLAHKKKLTNKQIVILIGMTIGILVFSYPAMLSFDIFNYILSAKVFFHYHENPYIIMPIEFIGEPFLSFTRAANKIALYGPVWLILSGIPYSMGLGSFLPILFSFKLLTSFFYVLTGIALFKLAKSIFPVMLFMLNPLVAIEIIVSGHNDIVMMFFVLFSYYLIQKKKILWAVIAFLVSIGIKYITIILLPIFIYLIIRTIQKKPINWNKIFTISGWTMIGVFMLSPIREEFYPWYVVWFLVFAVLVSKKSLLFVVSFILSFSTLLRYIPVLYTGSYGGITPVVKEILTFLPIVVVMLLFGLRKLIRIYVV